jgi:hypothetical protein
MLWGVVRRLILYDGLKSLEASSMGVFSDTVQASTRKDWRKLRETPGKQVQGKGLKSRSLHYKSRVTSTGWRWRIICTLQPYLPAEVCKGLRIILDVTRKIPISLPFSSIHFNVIAKWTETSFVYQKCRTSESRIRASNVKRNHLLQN